MKILFAGGGTAGHITPAIAIAEEFMKSNENDVAFVGRCNGGENRLINNKGYKLFTVKAKGLKRNLSPSNIISLFQNCASVISSLKIIRSFKPDAVIGTGGYVCWPVLWAAIILKIPTYIHESNIYPGMVTKNLAKRCKAVLLNYEATKKHLGANVRTATVGNPIREEFKNITREKARKTLGISDNTVLTVSIGGSGGSEKLNEVILTLMKKEQQSREFRHVHVSGVKHFDKIKKEHPEFCYQRSFCKVIPYADNMPEYLNAADIIISRCGAMTLSEISAVGVSSILIPSPNVTDDHQKINAQYLVGIGAAVMLEEKDLNGDALFDLWHSLAKSRRKRQAMGSAAKEAYVSESAKKIADFVTSS